MGAPSVKILSRLLSTSGFKFKVFSMAKRYFAPSNFFIFFFDRSIEPTIKEEEEEEEVPSLSEYRANNDPIVERLLQKYIPSGVDEKKRNRKTGGLPSRVCRLISFTLY